MEDAAQFSRAVDLTRLTYLVRIRSGQYYPLMAELVDAPVLGTGSERSVGSSPTVGTIRCIQQCIFNLAPKLQRWFETNWIRMGPSSSGSGLSYK